MPSKPEYGIETKRAIASEVTWWLVLVSITQEAQYEESWDEQGLWSPYCATISWGEIDFPIKISHETKQDWALWPTLPHNWYTIFSYLFLILGRTSWGILNTLGLRWIVKKSFKSSCRRMLTTFVIKEPKMCTSFLNLVHICMKMHHDQH